MRDKIHLDKSGAAGRSNHRASARARSVAPPNRSRHASTAATSDLWNLREQPVNRRRDDLQQQGNNRPADRKLSCGSNASRSTGMIGFRSVAGSKSSTPVYKPIARDLLSSSYPIAGLKRFLAPSVLRWARPPCCPGVDVRFQKRRSTKAATKQNFGGWSLTSRSPARRYKPRRGGRSQGVNLRFMTRRKTIVAKCISATANRHSGATTNRF